MYSTPHHNTPTIRQMCLRGQAFPRGELDRDRVPFVKRDVVSFLLVEPVGTLPDAVARMLLTSSTAAGAISTLDLLPGPYPRIQALALFDLKELLDVMTILFDEAVADNVSATDADAADLQPDGDSESWTTPSARLSVGAYCCRRCSVAL